MVSNFVSSITEAFNSFITGMGNGVVDFFQSLFLKSTKVEGVVTYTNELTTFAQVGLIMIGVGLAMGIARWIIRKVGR